MATSPFEQYLDTFSAQSFLTSDLLQTLDCAKNKLADQVYARYGQRPYNVALKLAGLFFLNDMWGLENFFEDVQNITGPLGSNYVIRTWRHDKPRLSYQDVNRWFRNLHIAWMRASGA